MQGNNNCDPFSKMMKSVQTKIRNVKIGIKNIIRWLPVVWNDRQWSYEYFWDIMYHKLFLMHDNFVKDDTHVDSEQTAKQIARCMELVDRFRSDWYEQESINYMEKKWGELKMTSIPVKNNEDVLQLHFSRPGVKTQDDEVKERADSTRTHKWEQEQYEKDVDELFSILKGNIRNWWN